MVDEGLIERNDMFLKKKHLNLETQLANQLRDCTFRPKLCTKKSGNVQEAQKREKTDVGARLYQYYEHYEQRKKKMWGELHSQS